MILSGLSVFGDTRCRAAAAPLFNAGEVEAIEWSVDAWEAGPPPPESAQLLEYFGAQGRLAGHCVHYPLLDARADEKRARWLQSLRRETEQRIYSGLSVHFGFSTGWEIAEGAPLPVPLCRAALDTGRRAMAELAQATPCRTGIENLALAFSMRDVETQGGFIAALLEEVDGFLLLDLHNIYCQSHNFGIGMIELAQSYPLERAWEIHVSGGSWSEHAGSWDRVRRDTHDGRVPDEVLEALPRIIGLCPNLKCVMLEKLPQSFANGEDEKGFRDDFRRMKQAVQNAAA